MLAKSLFECEAERFEPPSCILRIFQASQTLSSGRQVEQRGILTLPFQRRIYRLLTKPFESSIVQPKSFNGLLGCPIIFSCGNLAPQIKDKACLTTGRARRYEKVLLRD